MRRRIRYLKGVEVHFTPEQEAQLQQAANRAGIEVERMVKDVLLRAIADGRFTAENPAASAVKAALPVWRLGEIGPLHRQDIYDDVH